MARSIETKAMPKQEFNYLNFVFTTIPGGWLEKVELRLSQLSTKIEVEVDLKLSLAKVCKLQREGEHPHSIC